LSLYKDGEPLGRSNETYPTKIQGLAVKNAMLFGVVIGLIAALVGTQLKGSITKTMERFGRSLALEGQLSAQWFKAKTTHQ
jgi:hypothetical protein